MVKYNILKVSWWALSLINYWSVPGSILHWIYWSKLTFCHSMTLKEIISLKNNNSLVLVLDSPGYLNIFSFLFKTFFVWQNVAKFKLWSKIYAIENRFLTSSLNTIPSIQFASLCSLKCPDWTPDIWVNTAPVLNRPYVCISQGYFHWHTYCAHCVRFYTTL